MTITLERAVFHLVNPPGKTLAKATVELPVASLHTTIQNFFIKCTEDLIKAEDSGNNLSARFNPMPNAAQTAIQAVWKGEAFFFDAASDLAQLLFDKSPNNASAAVLAVLRCRQIEDNCIFAVLFKVYYRKEAFVHLEKDDQPNLVVQEISNVLVERIQKGAIFPHPQKQDFDLKVCDFQESGVRGVSRYFLEQFLNCKFKISDEHQIQRLPMELEEFAQDHGLTLQTQRLPELMKKLAGTTGSINAAQIEHTIHELQLFSGSFPADALRKHLERESAYLVPAASFAQHANRPRRLIYRVTAGKYQGLEISGPADSFAGLPTLTGGDTLEFHLQVNQADVRTKYE